MKEPTPLLPCPFCGTSYPFTYISFSTAVLRCTCGATMKDSAACVMYKREELPPELKDFTYEPTALTIKKKDGTLVNYPDHGYVGINALAAFEYHGITAKWNKRT